MCVQDLPRQPLYRVTFHQQHVWEGYTGKPEDTVDVEVYQAWLKPASKAQFEQQQRNDHHIHEHRHEQDHHHAVEEQHGGSQAIHHEAGGQHGHEGHHGDEGQHGDEGHHAIGEQHGDPQAIDHGDHVHEGRVTVEQNAIDLEGQDDAERRRLPEALIQAKP